jgi:phospholipase C
VKIESSFCFDMILRLTFRSSYFDHVPTPLSAPNPDGITVSDFNFTRLGVRVPTLLISPWVEAGSVLSKPNGPQPDSQFEHSSIPATIKKVGMEILS